MKKKKTVLMRVLEAIGRFRLLVVLSLLLSVMSVIFTIYRCLPETR